MYLITNRSLSNSNTIKAFGKKPNPSGPNELRLVKVEKRGNSWRVKALADKLTKAKVKELKTEFKLDIDINSDWHSSLEVACQIFEKARTEKRAILFFVHGYNNDVSDVLKAADELESLYNVIAIPFTWPANGGGAISGTASYLSDKSDARASAGALNRTIGKIQSFHLMLTAGLKKRLHKIAIRKHPNNPEAAAEHFVSLTEKECPVTINLLCHSMGNYVLKHTLTTNENNTSKLVFDNICLVAADTNNQNHSDWVGKLDTRKRVYIAINENDGALRASRIKPGNEQRARLGHYTKELTSPNAHYIDLTKSDAVGSKHGYFKGDAIQSNANLKELFNQMFNGQTAEHLLDYRTDNNSYSLL